MSKVKELEKKQAKIEKEIERTNEMLEQKKKMLKEKQQDLERINAEIITTLLVENNMSMADLTQLLTGAKEEILSEKGITFEEEIIDDVI